MLPSLQRASRGAGELLRAGPLSPWRNLTIDLGVRYDYFELIDKSRVSIFGENGASVPRQNMIISS